MTDIANAASPPARYANGRFGPGNSGRRFGSRNRVSHRVVMGLLEHFETHQGDILDRLARSNSALYINVLTRLLPRLLPRATDFEPAPPDDLSETEIAVMITGVLAAVQENLNDPCRALTELEAVLDREIAPEVEAE